MSVFQQLPKWAFRWMSLVPRTLFRLGLGRLLSSRLLVLETTGRKTGNRHLTPVQYERVDGQLYLGSARGEQADWFKNAKVNPAVRYNLGHGFRSARAKAITDRKEILNFLRLRLQRHPAMMKRILSLEGIPADPSKEQLASYAQELALLVLHVEK